METTELERPGTSAPASPQPSADELMRRLNVRQRKFVVAYLDHGSGLRAAREAGYRNASQYANRVLGTPQVKAAIDALMRESGPNPADLIADLARIIRFDPTSFDSSCYKVEDGRTVVDMDRVRELGLGPMVKRIAAHGRTGNQSIIWYDRAEAIALLGKFLGLSGPETAVTVDLSGMSINELKAIVNGR